MPAGIEALRLSDDFVPGDIIARFRDEHPAVDTLPKRARFAGMRVRGGKRRANLLQMDEAADHQHSAHPATRVQRRKLRTIRQMKRLRRAEEVLTADLNYRVHTSAVPNDAFLQSATLAL